MVEKLMQFLLYDWDVLCNIKMLMLPAAFEICASFWLWVSVFWTNASFFFSTHSITQISLVVLFHLEWKEKEMLTENCCLLEVNSQLNISWDKCWQKLHKDFYNLQLIGKFNQ